MLTEPRVFITSCCLSTDVKKKKAKQMAARAAMATTPMALMTIHARR